MSWSVAGVGKAAAVARKLEADFASQSGCVDPEESVRQSARSLIAAALAAQHPEAIVTVSANGHQGARYVNNAADGNVNTLNISIQPLHGFVE